MNFNELLNLVSSDNPRNICVDSRTVGNGDIFVAVKGTACDGHDFINQALDNGAKYIVCQQAPDINGWQPQAKLGACPERSRGDGLLCASNIKTIVVDDSIEAAAILAQAVRGNPACYLTNLAVTGTNGKTTVAFLVRSCIRQAGQKCGLLGTVIYDTCSGNESQAVLTTPDCMTIAAAQEQMLKNGAEYMVIEASSHALSQNRLAGINFKAAAFTNLAGDHLDYHKTEKDYLAAKSKLFSTLSHDAVAVLNKQSQHTASIAEQTEAGILWYAIDEPADIIARIESMDTNGTVFKMEYAGQSATVTTPLLGLYNVSNSLAAAGLCLAAGFDLNTIAAGLSALKTIPGRLEKIDFDCDFSVLVDYAHTDDALKNVLSTLKHLCKGRLIAVFGCGGDRDKTKRPRMAKVAEQLADLIFVTSDNPRTENPHEIIKEIIAGFANPDSKTIFIDANRKKAIESAIKTARKNDILLIAGKGHETYQIIGKQKFDFNDKKIANKYLKKLK
jgi:UDP-N-acetylmuramoyl-L-alanyl-D-glutamate--2,6-diaminopimelate ligase